jgi:hypothetical protein
LGAGLIDFGKGGFNLVVVGNNKISNPKVDLLMCDPKILPNFD